MGWAARARHAQGLRPSTRPRTRQRGPSRWLRIALGTNDATPYRVDALGRSITSGALRWVPTFEWDAKTKSLVPAGRELRRALPKVRGKSARRRDKAERRQSATR